MIYTSVLGNSNAQLGSIVLGAFTEAIQDIVDNYDVENPITVLTYKGEEWVSDRLVGTAVDKLYIIWGTGSSDQLVSKEDVRLYEEDLTTPRHLAKLVAKEYWPIDGSGRTIVYEAKATLIATNDIDITEVGLYDASGADEDISYTVYPVTTGEKTFAIENATQFTVGQKVRVSFMDNPNDFMEGLVVSCVDHYLTVNIDYVQDENNGTVLHDRWNIRNVGNLLMHGIYENLLLNGENPLSAGDKMGFTFILNPS